MSQAKPLILLPCEPFNRREVDPDFEPERQAAKATGRETALLDHPRGCRLGAGLHETGERGSSAQTTQRNRSDAEVRCDVVVAKLW